MRTLFLFIFLDLLISIKVYGQISPDLYKLGNCPLDTSLTTHITPDSSLEKISLSDFDSLYNKTYLAVFKSTIEPTNHDYLLLIKVLNTLYSDSIPDYLGLDSLFIRDTRNILEKLEFNVCKRVFYSKKYDMFYGPVKYYASLFLIFDRKK